MAGPAGRPATDDEWRAAGDRIQNLIDAAGSGGPRARERAEQLVREVVGLYGEALIRVVAAADEGQLRRLTDDDLVASLLLVHGLHPHDVRRRVSDALDRVRPYLGSHGGDVELLGVTDGVVRLQFAGSCRSCPSSAVTLELAVEDAVRAAAPEVTGIEVVPAEAPATTVISADSLLTRVRPTRWYPMPELAELAPGEVGGFAVDGEVVLACRVGGDLYAYRDHCPACDGSLAGAVLATGPMLACPRCRARYDVVHAGAGSDGRHLEPVPLLPHDGVLSVAIRPEPTGIPA